MVRQVGSILNNGIINDAVHTEVYSGNDLLISLLVQYMNANGGKIWMNAMC